MSLRRFAYDDNRVSGGLFGNHIYWRTSKFREKRWSNIWNREYEHGGDDVDTERMDPLYVPADCVVLATGTDSTYGFSVTLGFVGGGTMLLGHLEEPWRWWMLWKHSLRPGRFLKKGTLLAYAGNTGMVAPDPAGPPLDPDDNDERGSHVHVQCSLGSDVMAPHRFPIDPMLFMLMLDERQAA